VLATLGRDAYLAPPMANHKSAKKQSRQDVARRARNRAVKGHVRTLVKNLRQSLEAGDPQEVAARLRETERAITKASSRGVMAKRAASRKVSRLARAVARSS